jgi:spore coat protein A
MKKIRISRRKLLQAGATAGVAMMLPVKWFGRGTAYPFYQSPTNIRKFIVPLPGLGPAGIPVAAPNTTTYPGVDYYRIEMAQYTQQMHPDLPGPTTLWGYADVTNGQTANHRYLGGVVVAKKGRPVKLNVTNDLPGRHPLPVDTTIMGAEADQAENRTTVHLHGGLVPWTSDGGPFTWFTPGATGAGAGAGECFLNYGGTPGSAEYFYPNDQSARLMWYHDHALGITRLNAYAGLASAYIIRDDFENALIARKIIPSGAQEVPLVIQDKTFIGPGGNAEFGGRGNPGDLWYPSVYEDTGSDPLTGRWDRGGSPIDGLPIPSAVPEFFSDTILVNGAPYPFLQVEPRHYRFRILNGSQARF